MNWKNTLCTTLVVAGTLLSAAGCTQAGVTVDTQTSPASTTATPTQTSTASTAVTTAQTSTKSSLTATQPAPSGTRQPQSGISGNGTNPQPPSGNVTGERPAGQTMDMAAAAAKLGVTEQQLTDAMGNTQQGMPDFASVAQTLGCTETALREALGFSNNGTMPQGTPPAGTPPVTTPTVQQ
jgi:hypothetical protein